MMKATRAHVALAACVAAALLPMPRAEAQSAPVSAGGVEILNENSCWRYHLTLQPPAVTPESFKAAGRAESETKACPRLAMNRQTAPPPADWLKADFDDTSWPRAIAAEINTALTGKAHSFRASLRGKFNVTGEVGLAPGAQPELSLAINYRGGVRVWLNGVEVARQNLPAGELADDTPGELYPNEAWADGTGKAIGHKAPWPAVRDRSLAVVRLPASAVRKGVNVLAVELRRSPFHPVALAWNDSGHPPSEERWVPLALLGIRLSATGNGAVPNITRPAGLQAWPHDRNNHVTVHDRGDPTEAFYAVRIVGARNGSYCGQVGVGSDVAIKGLKAELSDLKHSGGRAIAATNVALLYGVGEPGAGGLTYDERLAESPPAEVAVNKTSGAAVLPIVLRVRIPADAAPGEYRAELTVTAASPQPTGPVRVPVLLHVADWKVPDPRDYRTFASIYQSPETVAMTYKVEPWTEPHWKLLERSWQLLGRAANKVAVVHAVEQTQFGNEHSTVFWIKKPDGSYDWDFSVFDRYLAMAVRHCGRLDHVALQMVHVGNIYNSKVGWATNPIDQVVTVTTKDPATGKLDSLKAPLFDTPEGRAFWKPYLAAVSQRLDKLGLRDALCVGILMDTDPRPEMVRMFDEIWPDGNTSRWMRGCHVSTTSPKPYPAARGVAGVVVLHEHCYGGGVRNPKLGEARGFPGAYYFRNSIAESRLPLTAFMTFGDYCLYLTGGHKGIGRICLDYWSMGRAGRLFNRFPYSDCMQRAPTICALSWPGPDGALPTQRLEALIEGLQECEAVIVLSDALDRSADRLGEPLAQRCRAVLDDRRRYADLAFCELENRSYGWAVPHPNHYGWQDITRRLYEAAAEASAKLAK